MYEIILKKWGHLSMWQSAGMAICQESVFARSGGLKNFLAGRAETIFDKSNGGNGELSHLLLYTF